MCLGKSTRTLAILALLGMLLLFIQSTPALAQHQPVRIGVLAKRGPQLCLDRWTPTAEYLSDQVTGESFVIEPLDYAGIEKAVAAGEIDFVIANSSIYVEQAVKYGVTRIATLINNQSGNSYVVYGGVIFRRSERNDIQELKDLRRKSFAAVDETSFGGWRMAWREMKLAGINPFRHFSTLTFMGTCDAVVYAVLKGEVDAATVRTDILERMATEGKIDLADVTALNIEHAYEQDVVTLDHERFPFLHSTPLYPEWPFARLSHTPDKLAEQVAVALLKMPEYSKAANAAMCAGWTVPLDYTTVEACLKDIKVGPFAKSGEVNIKDVLKAYWPHLVGIALLLSLTFSIYVTFFNQRLANEVIERKSAEQALQAAYFDVEQIIQTISSGMRIIDRDFNVIKANAALAELTGRQLADIQGSKCYDSFPLPQCHTENCPLVLTLAGRRVQEQQLTRTAPDGSPSICILSAWPFKDAEGNIIGMLEELRDITESKQAEEALREGQVIAAELAAIHKTTATYAHEVNNPLTGILATIQLLAESDCARDEEKEMLADALHAAYRIRDVILEMQVMCKPKYRRYLDRSEIIDLRDDADIDLSEE